MAAIASRITDVSRSTGASVMVLNAKHATATARSATGTSTIASAGV